MSAETEVLAGVTPGEVDESRVDDLVDALVDVGPEDARTIIPRPQAEVLVRRDLVGQSRQETADAIDKTVWAVDGRLARARANVEAVADLDAVLDRLGAFDLRNVDTDVDGSDDVEVDPEADAWGRLMTLDAVVEVNRTGDHMVAVTLDDATDHDRGDVTAALAALGYTSVNRETYGAGRETLRAWPPGEGPLDTDPESAAETPAEPTDDEPDESPTESDEPEVHVCHYCGDGYEPTTELEREYLDAPHPVCSSCMLDVTQGAELDPLDRFTVESDDVDESDDEDDDEPHTSDGEDETDESDDAAESEGYTCGDCGAGPFDTPGGLGGHRRYCDERDDEPEADDESDDDDAVDEPETAEGEPSGRYSGDRDDAVDVLNRVGKARAHRLNEAGLDTVGALIDAGEDGIAETGLGEGLSAKLYLRAVNHVGGLDDEDDA